MNESFFSRLVDLSAEDALEACEGYYRELRTEVEAFRQELSATPRGDKQGAHEIKRDIMRTERQIRRVRESLKTYRASVDKAERHGLWADGVRAVCGDEALKQVFAWMKAERKARA